MSTQLALTVRQSQTTLEGWVPAVGGLVWQQLYDPTKPRWDSTIEERIANGQLYGARRMMRLYSVGPCPGGCGSHDPGPGVWHFHLRDPWRPTLRLFPTDGREGPSWCESDWVVLEDASEDGGVLF